MENPIFRKNGRFRRGPRCWLVLQNFDHPRFLDDERSFCHIRIPRILARTSASELLRVLVGSLDSRRSSLQFRRHLAGQQGAQGSGEQRIQLDRNQKPNGIQK